MLKRFLFASLAFGLAGILLAQYEVSVTTIPVWVKVQDKSGAPVKGLTIADFELFEDGKKVQPSCFEEVTLNPTTEEAQASSEEAGQEVHRFVLYLDLYNTTPREYSTVKPALQQFLDRIAGKNVEVMLVAFNRDQRLGVVSKFTNDLRRVKIMLDFAKANPSRDLGTKSKADMLDVLSNQVQGSEKTNDTTREDTAIDSYQTARVLATQDVNTSRMSLRALETFADYISDLDLRNHASIILVSGGFSVDPGKRYFNMADAYVTKTGDVQSANNRPQFRQTGFSFQEELQESIGKLNKLNVTLYTLDTRASTTEPEFQDSLIEMARETGGIAFYNSDNFTSGLTAVQEDLKHQYLLCYAPPEHKTSGKYHKIRVKLNKNDVNIRYRDGYWD